MFLSRWFRLTARPNTYKPTLSLLEDRTVPTGLFNFFQPPGAATHLQVIVPTSVTAGNSFDVIVEAKDASNHLATGYNGSVQLSLGTPDAGASVPTSYTFTTGRHGDDGIHVFHLTLAATGSEMINASGSSTGSAITGSATTTVSPAPVATQLLVITPEKVTVGVPTYVAVVAQDASGHRVNHYTGTVSLTSTSFTTPPASYNFAAGDHGIHTFQVTFTSTGTATVQATGVISTPTSSTITGQASLMVNPVGTVTHFAILTPHSALANVPAPIEIVALDANNDVVDGYSGTIHFNLLTGSATLPADYTFTTSNHGAHFFTATYPSTGTVTFSVADTANSATASTVSVKVKTLWWHFPF